MNKKQIDYRKSLIGKVATIIDGGNHSEKPNRTGGCNGYYAVLIKYIEENDEFMIGWKQWVPAVHVDTVKAIDEHEAWILSVTR